MERPFKIEAGSAAKAAEDEARDQREALAGREPLKVGLRLAPRASSVAAPEAIPGEQFQKSKEFKLSAATGQKFDRPLPAESKIPPAPEAQPAAPVQEPPPAAGVLGRFLKLFGFGK